MEFLDRLDEIWDTIRIPDRLFAIHIGINDLGNDSLDLLSNKTDMGWIL